MSSSKHRMLRKPNVRRKITTPLLLMPLTERGLIIFKVNYFLVAMLIIKESAHCWSDSTCYYSSTCPHFISGKMRTGLEFDYEKPVSKKTFVLFLIGNNNQRRCVRCTSLYSRTGLNESLLTLLGVLVFCYLLSSVWNRNTSCEIYSHCRTTLGFQFILEISDLVQTG